MFLLVMGGRSFLRDAIYSFLCGQMPEEEIILLDSAEEFSSLTPEQARNLQLVLLYIGEQAANSFSVLKDLKQIKESVNGTPTILLGEHTEPSQAAAAIQAGARGYIPAALPSEIIKHVLPLVAHGGIFAPPFLYAGLGTGTNNGTDSISNGVEQLGEVGASAPCPPDRNTGECEAMAIFTDREIEVLRLLGAGLPNKLIAHRLSLKEGTVKVHMRNVMRKLKVSSRTQAALFANRHLEPEIEQ